MKTITCNDEAAPWSRSNHLMGTRLPPSSDDIFSGTPLETLGLRYWSTRTHLWLNCLAMYTFIPCLQFFCLLKPIACVCTLKMAEDKLSAHSASSQSLFIWCLGVGARPGIWNLRSLGLGFKTLVSLHIYIWYIYIMLKWESKSIFTTVTLV
jgi:hypothetical protein